MPATIEIVTTRPGRTLTMSAFPDGSDTAAITGEELTEAGNRSGLYTYSNTTATGLHLLILYDSSTPIWQAWAVLATTGSITASESREDALLRQSLTSTGIDKTDYALTSAYDAAKTAAAPGAEMALVDDAITAGKFDESTAFPLTSQDSGSTRVARTGSDSDTLETISDQMDDLKSTAEAISVSAARRIVIQGAKQFERPESGSTVYTIEVRTYSPYGADVDADTTPALTVTGKSSGDLSANLGTASSPSTGRYLWDYTVEDDAAIEELIFSCSADIDSETFTISLITQVTDFVSETFTASDRSKINAIHAKLPSKDYLTGTANADGDVQADEMTGNFPGSVASVSGNVGGNVTGSIGSLGTQAKLDVNAEADQALSDYGAAKPSDIPSASSIASAVWSNGTRTLSSFGTLVSDIATAVWSATTRVLTAGTNIVLAKGTGITGLNDLDSSAVQSAASAALTEFAPLKESNYTSPPTTSAIVSAIEGDGTKLTEIHDKLPEAEQLAGSPNADGSIEVTAEAELTEEDIQAIATDVLEGLGLNEGQRVATPGDVQVIVGPVQVRVPSDIVENTLYLRLDDTSQYRVESVVGVDGLGVDLSAYDRLELLFETRSKSQLEILDVEIINDGAGFRFRPSTAAVGIETQAHAPHLWALRNPDDVGETGEGRVICGGPLIVTRFATRRST